MSMIAEITTLHKSAHNDGPAQAERSYHELVDEPIVWNIGGESRILEVSSRD